MTVSTINVSDSAVGNGASKVFYFTFKCLSSDWVKSYLDDAPATPTVFLNADQVASPGGRVTFGVAPADGVVVLVRREIPLTQDVDYLAYDSFPAETHEAALDRVTMQVQGEAGDRARADDAEAAARIAADAAERAERIAADAAIIASGLMPANVGIAPVIATGSNRPRTIADRLADTVNVLDFSGVDPTGVEDSTVGIQEAFDAAEARIESLQPGGISTATFVEVVFPAGRYKISDEISASIAFVRALGVVTIEQSDDTKGCFSFHDRMRLGVEGFTFVGGAFGIHFENANLDLTTIDIKECEFQGTLGYSIELIGTSNPPTDVHLSAQAHIQRCRFYDPRQVLLNHADGCVFEDCWVSWHYIDGAHGALDDTAAFVSYGGLTFRGFFGVPGPDVDNAPDMRWIDNYSSFASYDHRFGGEGGGIPVLWNYGGHGDAWPYYGSSIIFKGGWISGGNNFNAINRSGVVILKDDLPATVVIEGNEGMNPLYMLIRDELADIAATIAATPHPETTYCYRIRDNQGASPAVPDAILPFLADGAETERPWREVDEAPTSGVWQAKQTLLRSTQEFGKSVGFIAQAGGAPGTWGEFGKLIPAGWRSVQAVVDGAGNASATFTIPQYVRAFMGWLVVSSNPNSGGSGHYRNVACFPVAMSCGFEGGAVTQRLAAGAAVIALPTTGINGSIVPAIGSIVFDATGLVTRPDQEAGTFTVTWNGADTTGTNCHAALEPLFFY